MHVNAVILFFDKQSVIAREKSLYNHIHCYGLALQCLSLYSDFIQTFDILLQQVCECTFAAS